MSNFIIDSFLNDLFSFSCRRDLFKKQCPMNLWRLLWLKKINQCVGLTFFQLLGTKQSKISFRNDKFERKRHNILLKNLKISHPSAVQKTQIRSHNFSAQKNRNTINNQLKLKFKKFKSVNVSFHSSRALIHFHIIIRKKLFLPVYN